MFRLPKLSLMLTSLAVLMVATPAPADTSPFEATDVVVAYVDIQDLGAGTYRFTSTIEGNGTPLGEFSGTSVAEYSFVTEMLSNASMTLTGNDGTVWLTFAGRVDSQSGDFDGVTFNITGGTDAYEGASGDGSLTGMADRTTGAIVNFNGTITTP